MTDSKQDLVTPNNESFKQRQPTLNDLLSGLIYEIEDYFSEMSTEKFFGQNKEKTIEQRYELVVLSKRLIRFLDREIGFYIDD